MSITRPYLDSNNKNVTLLMSKPYAESLMAQINEGQTPVTALGIARFKNDRGWIVMAFDNCRKLFLTFHNDTEFDTYIAEHYKRSHTLTRPC